MSSETRVPPGEISGIFGAIVKRMTKHKLGRVPEQLGVAWNNPKVLKTLLGFSARAERWDACDDQLKSFAHMAAVAYVGCGACLDFGYFQIHNKQLDVEKAREVPRWRESGTFTPLERDVLEYAEAMSQTPLAVTDELSQRLQRRLGITTLYVTHDQIEALSMSNVIAVMSAGVTVQEGTPREIYLQPRSKFVAQFIGSTNQISGQVTNRGRDGIGNVKTEEGEISCGILTELKAGDKVVVVVRPESIVLHQKKPAHGDNILEGKIGAAMFLGEYVDCTIELGKNVLETHQPHSLRVRRGDTVWVELPVGDCMALPAEQ